ncbi:MAG: hypothetical protein CL916_10040 [Deltaproteobacteria bacterium]|nr:hypothetical protein [Deltaproteobacteria bacterium]
MILVALIGCQNQEPEISQSRSSSPKEAVKEESAFEESSTPSVQLFYIQSSTANLRSEASVKSKVLIGLPIGTKGEAKKKEGTWVYFQSGAHVGWVSSSLLAETKPTLDAALSQYQAARKADKRKWIERAAALAPQNKKVITMLIEELDYHGDSDAMKKAQLGLRALQTLDSIYFNNESFQDGKPEDYLMLYPSKLSCREEIKAIALRGAQPPSKQMIEKWDSWFRDVPKEDYWSALQQHCFEFHPDKTVWSLIAKDGLATWKSIELVPKLTVRTYIEEPCVGDRMPPPHAQINLSWQDEPELFFSTLTAPKTTSFPFIPMNPPKSNPVPNLFSKDGYQIHRSLLTGEQKKFGIHSVYLENEVGDGHYDDGSDPNSVLTTSLVVEWDSGKRSILHSAKGEGKYSYHPPEIRDIVLTDINQDGAPDFLLREENIGYILIETNQESVQETHTIEQSMPQPIGGC